MTKFWIRYVAAACIATTAATTPAFAGGLSDAIVESTPAAAAPVQPATRSAVPGWVVPAIALLVIGGVAAGAADSGGDGGDSGETGDGGPPTIGGVK